MNLLSQRPERSKEVLFQELDGEAVLLDLASEQYFGLDEIGTRIWQLLDEKDDLNAIYQELLTEYDVSEQQLESDLISFVQQLCEAGIITVHETSTKQD